MTSRLPLLLAACVAVLTLGAGCAEDVAPAVRVGDVQISDADLVAEIEEWTGNPQAISEEVVASFDPGTIPQQLAGQILGQRVDFELSHAEFEARDLRLSDELRQAAVQDYFGGDTAVAQQALAGFSDGYANEFVDRITEQYALTEELGPDGYDRWRTEAYQSTEIEVSPRYGTWDQASGAVTPPEGPAQPGSAPLDVEP